MNSGCPGHCGSCGVPTVASESGGGGVAWTVWTVAAFLAPAVGAAAGAWLARRSPWLQVMGALAGGAAGAVLVRLLLALASGSGRQGSVVR